MKTSHQMNSLPSGYFIFAHIKPVYVWMILLTALIFLLPVASLAQGDRFTKAMMSTLESSRQAHTLSDYQDLANRFERIAKAEKQQWTPWYYAAFYNLVANFSDTVTDRKNAYLTLAQNQIDEGLKVKPGESEFYVLKVMAIYAQLVIDPMQGMTLMQEVNSLIEQGKVLNPGNPRIYLEQAEGIYNMPEQFGGGKLRALPLLQEAMEKFNQFTPVDSIVPDWGKDRCQMMLTEAMKAKQ